MSPAMESDMTKTSYTVRLASDPERFAFNYSTLEEARSAVQFAQSRGEWSDAAIYRKIEQMQVDEVFGWEVTVGEPTYEVVA